MVRHEIQKIPKTQVAGGENRISEVCDLEVEVQAGRSFLEDHDHHVEVWQI